MDRCPYCKSKDIELLLNISEMPIFLSAVDNHKLKFIKFFDYSLSYCIRCELGFNSSPLPDDELVFIYQNYEYILPSIGIGSTKYSNFIELVKNFCNKSEEIVEIGSGDCFILKKLKESGYVNIKGIEPGPFADSCEGIKVLKGFYSNEMFEDESVDTFLMMHVFEHFRDPFEIIKGLKSKLKKNGKIILEVPNFSGFHHQHLFYYNKNFFRRLAIDLNLSIDKMEVDKDFDSLRVVYSNNVKALDKDIDLQKDYLEKAYSFNMKREKLNNIFSNNDEIVVWGAGSSAVLNICLVDKSYIDGKNIVFVDGDNNKVGKVLPIINKTVQPIDFLMNKEFKILIIMSSFYKEIIERIKKEGLIFKDIEVIF